MKSFRVPAPTLRTVDSAANELNEMVRRFHISVDEDDRSASSQTQVSCVTLNLSCQMIRNDVTTGSAINMLTVFHSQSQNDSPQNESASSSSSSRRNSEVPVEGLP